MKLNDFEFSGDYIITNIQHDSATPQDLNTLEVSRRDGLKLISSNFSSKEISISGIIKASTIDELEDNIDLLKRSVMITGGNLDLDYAGEYRRYIVDCTTCTISREHYNITYAPFEIKFKVNDPPFAKAIDSLAGEISMQEAFSVENSTQELVQDSFSVDGSAIPKAKIRYKFDAIGDISSIDFINLSTSRQLNIATAFTSGDELLIDHDNLNVTLNGEPVEFEGVFPDLKLGSNAFESNLYLSSGTVLDAYQTVNNFSKPLYGSIKLAQSFTISTNGLIPKIQLLLRKIGNINTDISLRIETDNGGIPSGTAVANGTYTISGSIIGPSAFWINTSCTDLELSSGTTYWIVISTTNGSSDNYYEWKANNTGGYDDGSGARFFSSWSTLTADFCFKIYKNIVDISIVNETQETTSETFSTTTYKDDGNTTANWDTSNSRLILPLSAETADLTHTGNVSDFGFGTTGYSYLDQEIVPSTNGVLSSVTYYIKKTGSPAGSVTAELWSTTLDEVYEANTLLASSTTTYAPASISTSSADKNFLFSNYPIASGTHYILRIKVTSGANDSNFYSIRMGYSDFMTGWSAYLYNSNTFLYNDTNAFNMDQYYRTYVTANNVGQSLELDVISSVIVAATLSKTDITLDSTSIAYALSSDGTNFESVTPGTEKWFTNLGNILKFRATLTGDVYHTPYVDEYTITYKAATILSATTQRIGQTFIAGFSGNLGRIKLNTKKFGTPGNLTISIYTDSGGAPDSLEASQEYTGSVLNDKFGWISVNFDTPASLTATTTYWIVISAAGVDSSNGYFFRTKPGDIYSDGALNYSTNSGTDYSEYTDEDMLLQTYQATGLQHQFDMKIEYNPRYL